MKKILCVLTVIAGLALCGCNKQLFDTTYHFDYAYIRLQDGTVIQGEVDSWKDFEDGDQLQIVINGDTYLVHSSNATLIERG